MTLPLLLIVMLFSASGGGQQPATATPQGDLAKARQLYAAASYEEALAVLPLTPSDAEADEVDRYKALCLLALGRTTDAEQALERLITRSPEFQITQEDTPRLVELFRDVRRRVLPVRAESLYRRAKADFEDRRYADASQKFAQAADIMGDPDVGSTVRMQELRIVAEEFQLLAEERLAVSGPANGVGDVPSAGSPTGSANPPAGAASPASASSSGAGLGQSSPAAGSSARAGRSSSPIYTHLHEDVKPPVEVTRRMPPWSPPADQAWRTFRGLIEVLVDANGRVERVQMLERIAPDYDEALTEAAWDWTFQPARFNGAPVRFRHRIQIILRPQ